MTKIVFMGTPDFAVGSLKALVETGAYEITAVVTQPDRPRGRGHKLLETPVKAYALSQGLPVYQPEKVKTPEFTARLKEWAPDLIVVAAFGQFLSQEILDIPTYGCVNVHASLLPKYRGAAPIQYAIIKGEKETGVTIMRMEKGMDTGAMYSKVTVPIPPEMSFAELHDLLMEKGAALLVETLPKIIAGLQPEPQNEAEATKATLLTKAMAEIPWDKSVQEVHDLIRGFDPVPGAYTYLPDGTLLKLWESRVTETPAGAEPGTVVKAEKDEFCVACGDKVLQILTVQPASKKRMPVRVFLNGHGLKADIYLTQKKNPSKQAKITNALLPVVQGYNNLNQEQRYQFRKLLRSFVKWYNFISQIIRMFSKDLHREYLFCKYLERLVPADPVTMIDITNKIKLEYYKLEKTFDGDIELKPENGVLEPQRIKNTPSEKEKKTPLSEVIKKINEEFGTKFTERDKVIFEDVFNTMVKDDKLKTSARSNGQQMFENNIMPKSFDDTLQNSYLENMEAYESWLKDKEKYNFMRKMMAEALYKAFLKEGV